MNAFDIFTCLLKHKPSRKLLLGIKKSKFHRLPNMLYEWYQKDFIIQNPQLSLLGSGSIKKIDGFLKQLNFKNPLIVTDTVLIKIKTVDFLTKELKKAKIKFKIFDGVLPNPVISIVTDIAKTYRDNHCDAIISVGGGSAHDSAKAACMLLSNPKKEIRKYQGLNVTKHAIKIPLICVNTTAGTGSEVTNVAVITDDETHFKMTLVDKYIQPLIAINDSDMMMGLPPKSTAWTGVDALVHAIESHLSIIKNPYVESYSRQAMALIYKYLPIAYANGSNKEAREKMALAEYMAGLAFNSASLGFIHSMSHAMSAVFNTPHGLANAVLMPYVLDYELSNVNIVKQLCKISSYMGIKSKSNDENSKASEFIKALLEFNKLLGIPSNLSQIAENINQKDLVVMSKKAMKDFCGISNPIQLSQKQVLHIYNNALRNQFIHVKYEKDS